MEREESGSSIIEVCGKGTPFPPCYSSWPWSHSRGCLIWPPGQGPSYRFNIAEPRSGSVCMQMMWPCSSTPTRRKSVLRACLASGLITNTDKSAVFPIHCEDFNLSDIMESFLCPVQAFPCKYLGLPLHVRALRRVEFQPLIDRVAARLSSWKGRLLRRAGRLVLVNSVLTSIPTCFLTIFPLKKWAIKKIDKLRRSFL